MFFNIWLTSFCQGNFGLFQVPLVLVTDSKQVITCKKKLYDGDNCEIELSNLHTRVKHLRRQDGWLERVFGQILAVSSANSTVYCLQHETDNLATT